MKKLFLPTLAIFLFSCTAKPWNKEAAKKWCMQDSQKQIDDGAVPKETAEIICDCAAEKMAAKYKSESEANADKYNQMQIGQDCAEEFLKTKK
ncbi:MAG: hypothetical protein ABL929_05720 [Ferruginibacter sp.]|nr:hypothetical protein [Ferruginibacter sp.]